MQLDKELRSKVFEKAINISVKCREFVIDDRPKKPSFMKDLELEVYYMGVATVNNIDIFMYMTKDNTYTCKGLKYRDCNAGVIIMSEIFMSKYRRLEQIEFINYAILNIITLNTMGSRISDAISDKKKLFHFPKCLVPKFTKFINCV